MVKIIYFFICLILTSCNNFIPGVGKWKENILKLKIFLIENYFLSSFDVFDKWCNCKIDLDHSEQLFWGNFNLYQVF